MYRQVPYHNFFHCVDVTHATFRFIKLVGSRARMTPTEKLSLMIAALCHDLDHPGEPTPANVFLLYSSSGCCSAGVLAAVQKLSTVFCCGCFGSEIPKRQGSISHSGS